MYDDDRDALAAEYVLGTLAADEREQAEALLVIDPGFAEIVRVWERRLGELNVMVEAVEPPPDVWDKIRAEIDGKVERAVPAIGETVPATTLELTSEPASEPAPDLLSEPAQNLDVQILDAQNLGPQDLDLPEPPRDLDEGRGLDEESVVAAL